MTLWNDEDVGRKELKYNGSDVNWNKHSEEYLGISSKTEMHAPNNSSLYL